MIVIPTTLKELDERIGEIEREMLTRALDVTSGNISAAAIAIGCSRPTFYRMLNKRFTPSERLFLLKRVEQACPV